MTPINRPKQTKDDIYYLVLAPNEIITCMKNCHKANEKKKNKLHLIILINKDQKSFHNVCIDKPKSKFIFHLTTPVTPNPPPNPPTPKEKN